MKSFIKTILIIFLSVTSGHAQELDTNTIESEIDRMVPERINDSTPGLVIGIVHRGNLIFSKGYGMANLSYDIPNSPKMVYNIGSVAKQFIGYSFAMLHQQGKLNIDDPVGKYLEDWPEFEEKVTLRHLLTHTSGYREAYMMSYLAGREIGVDRLSREECLEVVRRQPKLEYAPGSRYTYNSTAWVILAEILTKVTEMPADQWVTQNILVPLGMNDTQIEEYVGDVIDNVAESYSLRPDGQYVNYRSNRAIFGAADIYSSIEDLAKWITNFEKLEIGDNAVQELFLEPYVLTDDVNSNYALGISNSKYKGLKRYRHTGGHEAFNTQLDYYPEHELGIVTVSNYGGVGWLNTSEIAEKLLGSKMILETDSIASVKLDDTTLKNYTGSYIADTYNRTINVTANEGVLSFGNQKLIATSNNIFQFENGNTLKFETFNNGDKVMTLIDNSTRKFLPYKAWKPTDDELKELEGEYWSKELETMHHLRIKDGKLNISNRWIGNEQMSTVTKDIFNIGNLLFLHFERDNDGQIIGYNVNGSRTLGVYFNKK